MQGDLPQVGAVSGGASVAGAGGFDFGAGARA